jgi:hypothetical protein
VAHEQLTFLLEAIDDDLVELQVLPSSHERMPLHAFTILRFDDDPTIAHLDTLSDGVLEDAPTAVETYETIFAYLRSIALDPTASRRVVQVMKEALE